MPLLAPPIDLPRLADRPLVAWTKALGVPAEHYSKKGVARTAWRRDGKKFFVFASDDRINYLKISEFRDHRAALSYVGLTRARMRTQPGNRRTGFSSPAWPKAVRQAIWYPAERTLDVFFTRP